MFFEFKPKSYSLSYANLAIMKAGSRLIVLLLILVAAIVIFSYLSGPSSPPEHGTGSNTPANSTNATHVSSSYHCQGCNVIIISIDSLRADHLGAYGYAKNTSPNMDELASRGVVFRNYITPAYLTPISEFSMHTSLYPHEHGLAVSNRYGQEHPLASPPETIASILKKYNYSTAAISTSPEFDYRDEFRTGFDSFISAQGRTLPGIDETFMRNLMSRKFFLWIAIGEAHAPYGEFVPRETAERYEDPEYNGMFKNYSADRIILLWIYGNSYYVPENMSDPASPSKRTNLSQEDFNYIVAKYDSGIDYADQYVGNLSRALKALGLDRNTIIIVTSAHGEEFGEHGYIWHYDIYEPEIHVPLIMAGPGLGNRTIESQAQSIDVLPTILDFLQIPAYEKARGQSLAPLIANGDNSSFNKFVFIERTPLWEEFAIAAPAPPQVHYDFAVRTNGWKLIYRASRDWEMNNSYFQNLSGERIYVPEFELYNIREDPAEQYNLYLSRPDIANELKPQLFGWLSGVNQTLSFTRNETVGKRIFPYP